MERGDRESSESGTLPFGYELFVLRRVQRVRRNLPGVLDCCNRIAHVWKSSHTYGCDQRRSPNSIFEVGDLDRTIEDVRCHLRPDPAVLQPFASAHHEPWSVCKRGGTKPIE